MLQLVCCARQGALTCNVLLAQAVTLASVVWSALRVGSNTDTFLGAGGGDVGVEAGRPLLARAEAGEDEETSAGLDGDAPKQQPTMSAGASFNNAKAGLLVCCGAALLCRKIRQICRFTITSVRSSSGKGMSGAKALP